MQPKIIYKYQTFSEYSLSNLINNVIYFTPVEKFNDPYDSIVKFDYESMKKIGFQDYDVEQLKKDLDSFFIEHLPKHRKITGVSCFSETNENMLMWSHYADSHTGFCLGFDTSYSPFKEKLHPVTYSEEFKKGTFDFMLSENEGEFSAQFDELICQKYKNWEYEKEWRLIGDAEKRLSHDPNTLKSVYFGCRMKDSDKKTIRKILRDLNVDFYDTKINEDYYKLDIEKIET